MKIFQVLVTFQAEEFDPQKLHYARAAIINALSETPELTHGKRGASNEKYYPFRVDESGVKDYDPRF